MIVLFTFEVNLRAHNLVNSASWTLGCSRSSPSNSIFLRICQLVSFSEFASSLRQLHVTFGYVCVQTNTLNSYFVTDTSDTLLDDRWRLQNIGYWYIVSPLVRAPHSSSVWEHTKQRALFCIQRSLCSQIIIRSETVRKVHQLI